MTDDELEKDEPQGVERMEQIQENGGLLKVDEVAALLECHKMTVLRMLNRGEIPGAFKLGHQANSHWRIPRLALDAYIDDLPRN